MFDILSDALAPDDNPLTAHRSRTHDVEQWLLFTSIATADFAVNVLSHQSPSRTRRWTLAHGASDRRGSFHSRGAVEVTAYREAFRLEQLAQVLAFVKRLLD